MIPKMIRESLDEQVDLVRSLVPELSDPVALYPCLKTELLMVQNLSQEDQRILRRSGWRFDGATWRKGEV